MLCNHAASRLPELPSLPHTHEPKCWLSPQTVWGEGGGGWLSAAGGTEFGVHFWFVHF